MAAGLVSPLFVGRGEELAVMAEALRDALDGRCVTVAIGGEAGVGKTRFLNEVQTLAVDKEMQVAVGRCVELSQEGVSYAPLVGALRSLTRALDAADLEVVLGPARRDVARLLPELDPSAGSDIAVSGQAARLFELVLGVLERAAHHIPLLVVMEDLHWADPATLDLVTFLIAELQETPLLLVLTYRSDEMHRSHPLRAALSGWNRGRQVQRLDLPPLTAEEVGALMGAILSDPPSAELVERVLHRSEGNPFLAEELIAVMRDGSDPDRLPDSIRDLLLARVTAVAPEIQVLLRAVSANAGRPVMDRLLAAVTGQDLQTLQGSLRIAVEHQLLVVDDSGGFVFRHALTREAAYDDMLPGEREHLHAGFGAALEADATMAGVDAPIDSLLAYHWDAGRDLPRALVASINAATSSALAFGTVEALVHLERVAALWPRVTDAAGLTGTALSDVLVRAADLAILSGAPAKALTLVEQALSALPADEPVVRALLLEQKGRALRDMSRQEEQIAVLTEAMDLLPEDFHRERGVVLSSLGSAILTSDATAAIPYLERAAAELAQAPAGRESAQVASMLGAARIRCGDIDAGMDSLAEALVLAAATDNLEEIVTAQLARSDVFGMLGRHEDAIEAARGALEVANAHGMRHMARPGLALCNLIESLIRLGRWSEVDGLIAEHGMRESAPYAAAALAVLIGQLAAARGELATATRHGGSARELKPEHYDITLDATFVDSEVARLTGDLAGALAFVGEALLSFRPEWEERYLWPLVWQGYRIAGDSTGAARTAEPAAGYQVLSDVAAALPGRGALAHSYRLTVEAERARWNGTPSVELWRTALAGWRGLGEPLMSAYCLYRLAEVQCADGSRDSAVDALREGIDIATALGARPMAEELQGLARRARITVEEPPQSRQTAASAAPTNPFGLTERELQVLALIAAGRTNKDIAASLYISPKTAGIHVSHILDKLGVSGRVEAAALAVHLGLVSH